MSNPLGSELFDTQVIRVNEGLLFLEIGKAKGDPIVKTFDEIQLIDRLLILQRQQSLLTKKRRLKDQIENCIAGHLGLPTKNMNGKKR